MERIFLAVIVSGLLLAAASVSLLVATSGGKSVAELKVPVPPVAATAPAEKVGPHRIENGLTKPRDPAKQ